MLCFGLVLFGLVWFDVFLINKTQPDVFSEKIVIFQSIICNQQNAAHHPHQKNIEHKYSLLLLSESNVKIQMS